jgi:type VI secretion system secreted protein VgrG
MIDGHHYESIGVKGGGDYHREVKGKIAYKTGGGVSHEIGGSFGEKISMSHSEEAGMNIYLKAGMNVVIEAGMQLTLKGPGGFVDIGPAGVTIQGTMVLINSGGAAGTGKAENLVSPKAPEEALIAAQADPGSTAPSYKNQIKAMPAFEHKLINAPKHRPPAPTAADAAASDDKEDKKLSWIEIKLIDEDGAPVPGERYVVTLPDGKVVASGTLDSEGFARVDNIDPGNCQVTFPDRDGRSWEKS